MIDINLTPRQDEIIKAAFSQWGRLNFSKMSLSTLAASLSLTKSALYRHFRNKEALITTMEEVFLQDYLKMHREYQQKAAEMDAYEAVHYFIAYQYRFFLDNPYYYAFFVVRIIRPPMADERLKAGVLESQAALFRRLLAAQGTRVFSEKELFIRLHFLYVASIHSAAGVFFDTETGYARVPRISEEDFKKDTARAARFCMQGFMGEKAPEKMDYPGLEKSCAVLPEEMPPPDRIFTAVEQVVSREGLRKASVDKIAAQVGLSKSSLYFYFKNKDDLFRKTLEREKEYVTRIYADRFQGLNCFSQRSYCCMVKSATYTLNNPALLTFFDWLRFQNIAPAVPKPDLELVREMHSFILEARDRGEIEGDDDDLILTGSILFVAAFRIVMENPGLEWPEIARRLRVFHRLCMDGIFTTHILSPEDT